MLFLGGFFRAFCACVALNISDLLSMSPHLRLDVWPPIEHEVAIILILLLPATIVLVC